MHWLALNPMMHRELRTRMRGGRPYLVLTAFLSLMALAALAVYQVMQQQAYVGSALLSVQVGQALFRGLAFIELFLIVILVPALTAGAISGEREQLTYDMLLATPLRIGQILWGKLIGALSYVFLLIFAAIPLFSVVLVFGGVELIAVIQTLLLLLLTAIFFGTLGLVCSTLLRRTAQATALSYGLSLLLVVLPVVAASLWSQLVNPVGQAVPPTLVYLNPFSALLSITALDLSGGAPPDEMAFVFGFGDPLGGLPLLGALTPGVIHYGPWGSVIVPIYRATYLIYLGGALLLGWLSSHLARPARRRRITRSDLGFGLLLVLGVALGWLTRDWWYVLPPPM